MKIEKKEKRIIDGLIKNLGKIYLNSNNEYMFDFGYKKFDTFLNNIYKFFAKLDGFEIETFANATVWFYKDNIHSKMDLKKDLSEKFIRYIKDVFRINMHNHFLIFPLQKSIIDRDVLFGDFFIIKHTNEKEVINKIIKFSKINKEVVDEFLTHTKNTRSKDFLNYNLLLFRIRENSEVVKNSASSLYWVIVSLLNMLYRGYFVDKKSYNYLLLATEQLLDKNQHVVILSEDWIRCGFAHTFKPPICNSDINFLLDKKMQKKFVELFNIFKLENGTDLFLKFKNALHIYINAHTQFYEEQNEYIAMILYITALESLVAYGDNEKRLRYSILVPMLLEDLKDKHNTAIRLKNIYLKRNNFIHAGCYSNFDYDDNDLDFLDYITSRFILNYNEFCNKILSLKENNESEINTWNKFLKNTFDSCIYNFE